MTDIYLIRHGQASFGEQDYDHLSGMGITQSEKLGLWLASSGIRFDAVYSGERRRQRDTANITLAASGCSATTLSIDASFNELDADGLLRHAIPRKLLREPALAPLLMNIRENRDGFRRLFEQIVDEWVCGDWQDAGIGSWKDFSSRVLQGVHALAGRHRGDEKIAVFTSGGPITATLRELGDDAGAGLDWRIANTSITRLALRADGTLALCEQRTLPHLRDTPELVTHL